MVYSHHVYTRFIYYQYSEKIIGTRFKVINHKKTSNIYCKTYSQYINVVCCDLYASVLEEKTREVFVIVVEVREGRGNYNTQRKAYPCFNLVKNGSNN